MLITIKFKNGDSFSSDIAKFYYRYESFNDFKEIKSENDIGFLHDKKKCIIKVVVANQTHFYRVNRIDKISFIS